VLAEILQDTSKLDFMTKYFLGFILMLTMFSCKKNDISIVNSKKDYTSFLTQTTQTFQGKLDGANFSWSYGWNTFQGIKGYENGNGICDSTDPVRVVLFGLTSEGGGQTRFRIYSPKYNSTSDTEISQIFSLGKKKLGDFRTDFYLSINKDNNFYQSNSYSSTNEIEILKTQEFADYNGIKNLRVWFRLDAKLSSCSCQSTNTVLADGLMIAEFYGFRKGQ
jgi:hypothetical protein